MTASFYVLGRGLTKNSSEVNTITPVGRWSQAVTSMTYLGVHDFTPDRA
jgi:hypothetical protein